MRVLLSALAAAGIIGFSFGAYAADEPYTSQPKVQKPGRAIDDGAVTAPNKPKAAGRAIDDGTVTSGKRLNKPGREVDDSSVGAPHPKKFGRTIEGDAGDTVKAPNKKKHGRAIDNSADSSVKTKADPNKAGRAVNDEKK
jgi:hypothetical protein